MARNSGGFTIICLLVTIISPTLFAFSNTQANKRQLLVFGLGNIGTIVARRGAAILSTNNSTEPYFEKVYGTTRGTSSSGNEIANVHSIQFDSYEEIREILPNCTHILVTIPPFDESIQKAGVDPVLNSAGISLKDIVSENTWIGYTSSTSVYGDHDGEWVSEDSDVNCKPGTKGELYLQAENEWIDASKICNWRMHVFRCAGLYGDGRSALHTIRNRGIPQKIKRDDVKVENPTSRIHEEDVAQAILSAMTHGKDDGNTVRRWNLADDNPAPRSEVMRYGVDLLKSANLLPNKSSKPSSVMTRSERYKRRKKESKRVSNKRMRESLLPNGLLYPTYREGLKAVLDANNDTWG
ncbi:hypothetical protein ACHAWC_008768 [Mediolabrus comicus]